MNRKRLVSEGAAVSRKLLDVPLFRCCCHHTAVFLLKPTATTDSKEKKFRLTIIYL